MNAEYTLENIKEIGSAMTKIRKNYGKNERWGALEPLCTAIWRNHHIFYEYFSSSKYTYHHCDIAAKLFHLYGKEVYLKIQKIIPAHCGEIISTWDDFMVYEIPKIVHIATHPWHNDRKMPLLDQFIQSIEQICDEDLFLELMTYISRDEIYEFYFNKLIKPENYPIDYNFIMKRSKLMNMNHNSMRRYVHLVSVLAEFDYVDAFRAWGQFYYIFEDVYLRTKSRKSFTADLYDAFIVIPQRKFGGPSELLLQRGMEMTHSTIYQYGWDVLHHIFEINADFEDNKGGRIHGQSLVYEHLSEADRKKADDALYNYKKKTMIYQKQSVLEKEDTGIQDILQLLRDDLELGLNAWQNLLISIREQSRKITKKQIVESLDQPLRNYMNWEQSQGKTTTVVYHDLPLVKIEIPNIVIEILDNKWLTEFIFSHCVQYGYATSIASVLLMRGQTEVFDWITLLIKSNHYLSITADTFYLLAKKHIWFTAISYLHACWSNTFLGNDYKIFSPYFGELVDFTKSKEWFHCFCTILKKYIPENESALHYVNKWMSKAENNRDDESHWFLERYDLLLDVIDFSLKSNGKELLDDWSSRYTFFRYGANVDRIRKILQFVTVSCDREYLKSISRYLENNNALSNMEKMTLIREFALDEYLRK